MFYGWKIVAATFVTWFISVGFLFYSYGVFFPALEKDFGGSRFAISTGLAIMSIAMAILSPFLGRAIDQWSIRNIMLVGSVCMSLGFFAASQITALWQLYILLATLMGGGASLVGQLPSTTLVFRWFTKRRGIALGVATMGVSMSGVVMAPVTTMLIDSIGWRSTFILFGALSALIITPLVALVIVNKPEDLGLHPDGVSDEEALALEGGIPGGPSNSSGAGSDSLPDFSVAHTLRNTNFWAIVFTFGLNFFAMGAVLTHMIPHAKDLGITAIHAAYVLTSCAGAGVLGKVVFGYIADLMNTRLALFLCMLFQFSGTLLLLFATSLPMLLVVGAIFGFGMGGVVVVMGSLIAENFSMASFGRVMGLMSPCMLPIQIMGVPFAGLVYDLTGEYDLAYKTFLATYALAAVALMMLRRPAEDPSVVSIQVSELEIQR